MLATQPTPVFTDPSTGKRWRRLGECSRCGECCYDGDGVPCPTARIFKREEDGRATCMGHGWHEFYLSGCHLFPTRPEDIENCPSCTYSFEEVSQ